jgi:hypothetical protein
MDFTQALTYPFDDEDWLKKLGLAVLIQFIPVVGTLALVGWSYEISRRVKAGDPTPLPDWSDFGGLLGKGFQLAIAYIIYQLPTLIFVCIISIIWVLPAMGGNNQDAAAALAGVAGIVAICCSCIIVLYAIAAAIVFWGGYVRYIDAPELSTFFAFGDNIQIVRDNLGDFGQALLFAIGGGLIAGVVSSVTAGIGSLIAQPFSMYFNGHILGQLAAKVGSMPTSGPAADVPSM